MQLLPPRTRSRPAISCNIKGKRPPDIFWHDLFCSAPDRGALRHDGPARAVQPCAYKPADWPCQTLPRLQAESHTASRLLLDAQEGYIVVSRVARYSQSASSISAPCVEIVPRAAPDMALSPDLAMLKSTAVES